MHLKSKFKNKNIVVNEDSVVTGKVQRLYGIYNEDTYVRVTMFLDDYFIFGIEKKYLRSETAEKAANRIFQDALELERTGVLVNGSVVKLTKFYNMLSNSIEDSIENEF